MTEQAAYWDCSVPDWRERLLSGKSLVPDLPLFESQSSKAIRNFKRLRVPDLVGRPRMEEVAGPWLFPIIAAIFGSYDPETRRRMIQEFFWLIPKKNSKTSSAAAIMVEALIMNERPEADFALVAPTKQIADISFDQASGTILADTELTKLFQIQRHIRTIQHRLSGANLQVKAADTDVITGGKQVGTLIDELHVLASKKDAEAIMVELRGALAARPDGFLITVTTQSKEPPKGVFKAELEKARGVRDGLIKGLPLLPILYELPPDLAANKGWQDRKLWPLVNPNLGRSVDLAFLEREVADANRAGVEKLALIASQHFNVEVGIGLRTDRWAGADFWLKRANDNLTLESLIERSEVITVGIDGGGLDDMLGLCVMGREKGTRKRLVKCWAWAHRIVLERRKEIAPQIEGFVRDGHVALVDDESGEDVVQAVDIIEQCERAGKLADGKAIGVDPVGISQIIDELERRRDASGQQLFVIEKRVNAVRQGWTLADKIKTVELQLAQGEIEHDGSPLMTWCVGNAKVEPRGNAILITKQVSGSAKIDPLMALFDAADIMATNPQPKDDGQMDQFLKMPLVA